MFFSNEDAIMVLHEPMLLLLSNRFQLIPNELRTKTPQGFGCNQAKCGCEGGQTSQLYCAVFEDEREIWIAEEKAGDSPRLWRGAFPSRLF